MQQFLCFLMFQTLLTEKKEKKYVAPILYDSTGHDTLVLHSYYLFICFENLANQRGQKLLLHKQP